MQSIVINETKALLLDHSILLSIPRDPPILLREFSALHFLDELLVMGDDDQLEVLLMLAILDDLIQ